ncbi:hypothetical protein CL647_01660 [bacterium]|nr:hypothetical protein [Actinomycetota bacterium]MBE32827.1 hypothetical protein [bacterium]|tara:strand:+ start:878 stop:1969 length:1092 start_codon:yes stop_codon:yes gene_type:complete
MSSYNPFSYRSPPVKGTLIARQKNQLPLRTPMRLRLLEDGSRLDPSPFSLTPIPSQDRPIDAQRFLLPLFLFLLRKHKASHQSPSMSLITSKPPISNEPVSFYTGTSRTEDNHVNLFSPQELNALRFLPLIRDDNHFLIPIAAMLTSSLAAGITFPLHTCVGYIMHNGFSKQHATNILPFSKPDVSSFMIGYCNVSFLRFTQVLSNTISILAGSRFSSLLLNSLSHSLPIKHISPLLGGALLSTCTGLRSDILFNSKAAGILSPPPNPLILGSLFVREVLFSTTLLKGKELNPSILIGLSASAAVFNSLFIYFISQASPSGGKIISSSEFLLRTLACMIPRTLAVLTTKRAQLYAENRLNKNQ